MVWTLAKRTKCFTVGGIMIISFISASVVFVNLNKLVRFLFMGKMSRWAIFMRVKYLCKLFLVTMGEPGLYDGLNARGPSMERGKNMIFCGQIIRCDSDGGGRTLCFFFNMRFCGLRWGGILAFMFPCIHSWCYTMSSSTFNVCVPLHTQLMLCWVAWQTLL